MKKILLMVLLANPFFVFAQSNPTPYNLSSNTYTFTQWDSTANINPALSYPPNMIFHTTGTSDQGENGQANGDWACTYDLQTGPCFKGRALEGIGFKNTGTTQNATCKVNGTGNSVFVGDAVLALNTTDCENIKISWIGRMLSAFTFNSALPNQMSRFYAISCQYRIGTSGSFTNVPGNYQFICNIDSATYKPMGANDTLVSTLPDTCNNQPVVEIRWIYYQTFANTGGQRPLLAVDDISVTRDIVTSIPTMQSPKKTLTVAPNPINEGKLYLNKTTNFIVLDVLGQNLGKAVYGKEYNTDNLSKGIYFIKTSDGELVKFIKQ